MKLSVLSNTNLISFSKALSATSGTLGLTFLMNSVNPVGSDFKNHLRSQASYRGTKGKKTRIPSKLKMVLNNTNSIKGSLMENVPMVNSTKSSTKKNTKSPVATLKTKCANANLFLSADPPKAPMMAVTVVPILAPMISTAP